MKRIAYICLLVICVSCEKDITDDFKTNSNRRIVISGEIVALDTPMVHISRTVSLVDVDSVYLIPDAMVELSSGDESYLMQHVGKGFFRADEMLIQPGRSYTLKCTSDDLQPAYVVIDVPPLPKVNGIQYFVDTAYVLHIEFSFNDPVGTEDIYSYFLSGWQRQIGHYTDHSIDSSWIDTTTVYNEFYHYTEDPILEYSDNYKSLRELDGEGDWGGTFYFSDKKIKGQSYGLSMEISLFNTYNDSIPEIELTFQQRDKQLIEYLLAYEKYDPYTDIDIDIMQPVRLYSNIDGGFGLVYALSNYNTVIDVSEWYTDPGFLERLNNRPAGF